MEEFRPAFGFETHYEVSNLGNLRRSLAGKGAKLLKNFKTKPTGYQEVALCVNGKITRTSIHRLVAATFIGPIPKGMCINHLDGNPANNRVENLDITTPSGNTQHAIDVLGWKPTRQIGEANGCALMTDDRARHVKYATLPRGGIVALAKEWGVKPSTLYSIRCGRNWIHV